MSLFRSASFKLTLFYVAIVMIVSVSFSVVIYKISSLEIGTGLARQTRVLREIPPPRDSIRDRLQDLESIRLDQLETSNTHLKTNLFIFNVLILVLSSIASYFFARYTLRPIEEMMEAQSRFTADASHELKTPLTAMKSEIEVTLRDKKIGSAQAEELLKSNLEEIGKLEALSKALLELASYENKSGENFKELPLIDLITNAYEKVEKIAQAKDIEFENNLKELRVLGDRQSLTELFVILLDNAIKYTREKSKIYISTKKEMRHAQILIRDEGDGIKKEDLPHIFNRFYRADSSRTHWTEPSGRRGGKIAGYGLGLAIAKQIVELHNGSISAESKVGKGTTFTVKLPLG